MKHTIIPYLDCTPLLRRDWTDILLKEQHGTLDRGDSFRKGSFLFSNLFICWGCCFASKLVTCCFFIQKHAANTHVSDSPHPPESSRNNGQKKVIQWKQPPSYTNIKPHFPMSRQFFREIILDILRYLLLCSFIIYQCVCVSFNFLWWYSFFWYPLISSRFFCSSRRSSSHIGWICAWYQRHLSHEKKNLVTFHYAAWFLGILMMAYYNPT